MKRALTSFALVLLCVGCAVGASPSHHPADLGMSKEAMEASRKAERDMYTRTLDSEQERIDKLEAKTLKALRVSLGKEAPWPGGQVGESASTALAAIKAAKLEVWLEPVTYSNGAKNDDYLQLKDSYTERLPALSRKMLEQRATKAEKKEVEEGAKYTMKLADLRTAVQQVSMQTMLANHEVQTTSISQMTRVAQIVRARRMYEQPLTADDYAVVKRGLLLQRRAEALAGASMAMMAGFQAIVDGDGDPKALDVIAEKVVQSFPLSATVSDREASDYVGLLGKNMESVKASYAAMMRRLYGEKAYERDHKAGVEALFKSAEEAGAQKSVWQIAEDNRREFEADRRRARSSAPGPSPAPASRNARVEDASLDTTALDAASKLVGEDSMLGASLKGVAALKRGDAKGALTAAVALVPIPGVKEALGVASKLLFKD